MQMKLILDPTAACVLFGLTAVSELYRYRLWRLSELAIATTIST